MTEPVRIVGRYALHAPIAAGGMATVHLGRLLGPVGFSRTVAIKRLHAQFAADPEFVSMFLDEARLATRIRHPNVVPTLDVVATDGELFLVMEYVPGESLARLSRVVREPQKGHFPLRILSATITGVLHGLHAAHEAKDEHGHALGIVHRDVSPQNVLLGTDGVPRVLDFGVAKASGRVQTTKEGQIKGKLSYMPPEQLNGAGVTRQSDVYAAGVMLWELVTGERLFGGDNEGVVVARILSGNVEPPSRVVARNRRLAGSPDAMRAVEALDRTILRALDMDPAQRFATARDMALAIEHDCPPATTSEVGDWVEAVARDVLRARAAIVAGIESSGGIPNRESDVMSVLTARPASGPPMPTWQVPAPVVRDGPPFTQPSSISVSAPSAASHGSEPPEQAYGTILAIVGGVLLAAVLLTGGVLYLRSEDHPADRPVPFETAAPPAATAPSSLPSALPPPAADPDVAVDAGRPPLRHAPGPRTARPIPKVLPQPVPAPPPAPAADDCSPPFWYDAAGLKHYKTQCLNR